MSRFFQNLFPSGEGAAGALPTPITPMFPDGIKELYCPETPIVDICFVHGLTGDREKTWTADGQSTSWPEKLLPGVLPDARILTFGYDAYIVKKGVAGVNGLSDHAANLLHDLTRDRTRHAATARPLVFVAHSLGGLVCKSALTTSRDSPEEHLRDVFDSVIGIAFMGTPHRGSWMADWAKIPVKSLGFKSKNPKLINVLRTKNEVLQSVHTTFVQMLSRRKQMAQAIEVACFYEEQPLPFFGQVVTRESATLDDILPFSIPANHMNMVRFASEADPGFDRLIGELQRWTQNLEVTLSPDMARVREVCLSSLHFPNMDMRLADVDTAMTGTCDWLLEHEQYRQWIEGQGLLLIRGKPGSGKSTLLKYAWQNTETGDDISLSFFFHSRGSALHHTPLGFLRSLAHQLLSAAPLTVTDLINAYQKNRVQKSAKAKIDASTWVWAEQDLQGYIMMALPKVLVTRPVWLFVDALDESSEPNDTFWWLQGLLNKALSGNKFPCHFLASCRPFPVLLVKHSAFAICTEDENARDIEAYVKGRLQEYSIGADATNSEIPGLVVERASGIFLWAHWVMEEIFSARRCGKRTSTVARNIVEGTPGTLAALYARQVEAMKDDQDSLDLMCWVCFAADPLTLEQLRWAIAMSYACGHESVWACEDAGDIHSIDEMALHFRSAGRGLLELTSVDSYFGQMQAVQFIHQTTKDFMCNEGLPALLGTGVLPAEAQRLAHFRLAKACIRLLAMEDPKTTNFWSYCDSYWLYHLELADGGRGLCPDEKEELLRLLRWPSIDLATVSTIIRFPSLVHALASHGVLGLLETVMQHEMARGQVNSIKDSEDRTALFNACLSGDSVVRILLENGADANVADEDDVTPLHIATEGGHDGMVRILLEKGAEANVVDNSGVTPLLIAATKGSDGVVRMLLENGADANVADVEGVTPLHMAAYGGHEDMVRILLENGAEADVKDRNGVAPLHIAANRGYDGMIRILLANGANAAGEGGVTPLHIAIDRGHDYLARVLLENGAEANVAEEQGITPLLLAAARGSDVLVRILLEKNADVNASDDRGQTPLFQAASFGRASAEGASIVTEDDRPLMAPAWRFESVVQMLVNHGADIHKADMRGRTPASVATERVRGILLGNAGGSPVNEDD